MNILYVNTDKTWYENDVINKVFPGSDRGNYMKKFKRVLSYDMIYLEEPGPWKSLVSCSDRFTEF